MWRRDGPTLEVAKDAIDRLAGSDTAEQLPNGRRFGVVHLLTDERAGTWVTGADVAEQDPPVRPPGSTVAFLAAHRPLASHRGFEHAELDELAEHVAMQRVGQVVRHPRDMHLGAGALAQVGEVEPLALGAGQAGGFPHEQHIKEASLDEPECLKPSGALTLGIAGSPD